MIGRPFRLALGLLTTLPMPIVRDPDDETMGASVLWYPPVGMVIGVMLWGLAWLLDMAADTMTAVLLLLAWLALTGGMHLEGLGDLADAWVGGHGRPERMMEIMKDPRAGPAAVMAIVMQLMVKFTAIQTLIQLRMPLLLLLAPWVGRTALVFLVISTPYVRSQGMGTVLAREVSRKKGWTVVALAVMAPLFLADFSVSLAVATTALFMVAFRRSMTARLAGVTGDVLGAACELSETVFLLAALLWISFVP
ncbi:MAG: adenosylcobinamide-GDP ribazoletransferase [Magnetococcales bacterium]|nr:adenosylcobinamide-GDP ribazoletransferase [Magnetococcales bacterium]